MYWHVSSEIHGVLMMDIKTSEIPSVNAFIMSKSPLVRFGCNNRFKPLRGTMKKWKPIGITALEYKEYKQNGCIRVKDYPKPNKKKRDPEDDKIPFTIYEVLDFDEEKNRNYSDFFWSFSFGYIGARWMGGYYKISVTDESKISLVFQRLRRFGLDPELADDGIIYADRPISIY